MPQYHQPSPTHYQQPQQQFSAPPPSPAQHQQQTFAVIAPQGSYPGSHIAVRAPNTGQQMTVFVCAGTRRIFSKAPMNLGTAQVVIPQGIGPGMQFLVPMPAAAPTPQYAQPQYQQPVQYQQQQYQQPQQQHYFQQPQNYAPRYY